MKASRPSGGPIARRPLSACLLVIAPQSPWLWPDEAAAASLVPLPPCCHRETGGLCVCLCAEQSLVLQRNLSNYLVPGAVTDLCVSWPQHPGSTGHRRAGAFGRRTGVPDGRGNAGGFITALLPVSLLLPVCAGFLLTSFLLLGTTLHCWGPGRGAPGSASVHCWPLTF